jgi:hypothetical protein
MRGLQKNHIHKLISFLFNKMALKLITFLLATSALIQESRLQVSKMGVCPKDIKPVQTFKAEDFKGTW